MKARFHTLHVPMAGIDVHEIEENAPPPVYVAKVTKPCAVACPFEWHSNSDQYSKTVTGHTHPMVQREYSLGFVPHLTTVATPLGAASLAATIVTSSSKAALGVASVSSEGRPLATSMSGNAGLNLNCQDPGGQSILLPSGFTISEYPLLTNPTDDDWVDFVITWGWDTAFGWALGHAVGDKIPPEQRAVIKKFISEKLQPLIERELRRIKDGMKVVTTTDSSQIFDSVLD